MATNAFGKSDQSLTEGRRGIASIKESGCNLSCRLARLSDQGVVGRQGAGRVGTRGIAGQREGLAAAAAPIDLAPVAGPAWLRHPGGAAKPREFRRTVPDIR